MELPKELEPLRDRKIWLCHPLVWNEKKHGGVGGYDKPPINPYTLYMGSSDKKDNLSTFDVAAAQIGKTARVRVPGKEGLVECTVAGVGIAFSGTGICGIDLDNVADLERRVMTPDAKEIIELMSSYTEVSPSGKGLHVIFLGELPKDIKKLAKSKHDIITHTDKAEYQLFDSGYMTLSGKTIRGYNLAERTAQVAEVYERYFREVEPIQKLNDKKPATALSVVSCGSGYTYERWLEEVKRLSEEELLERIFKSGSTGTAVKALYYGDMSAYNNDHSRADQALCTYLYGFTSDRELTERLFRSSSLYRATGKSRSYLERTLNKAQIECKPLIGHIEFTAEEKRAYAQKKESEERAIADLRGKRYNSYRKTETKQRYNSYGRR